MRAAYDALDDRTKAEIQDLACRHSNVYSRGKLGLSESSDLNPADEERAVFKPVRQRLVRCHRSATANRRSSPYMPAKSKARR